MTDARSWCPECEPWVNPLVELVVVDRCGGHRLDIAGSDDALVGPPPDGFTLSGTNEPEGIPNAAMCALLGGGR